VAAGARFGYGGRDARVAVVVADGEHTVVVGVVRRARVAVGVVAGGDVGAGRARRRQLAPVDLDLVDEVRGVPADPGVEDADDGVRPARRGLPGEVGAGA